MAFASTARAIVLTHLDALGVIFASTALRKWSEKRAEVVFMASSGYRTRFRNVPADYSEILVYAGENLLGEIRRPFQKKAPPNLFLLKGASRADFRRSGTCEWYAKLQLPNPISR